MTLGLNAAEKYRLYAKKFQIKVVRILITYKQTQWAYMSISAPHIPK